jgi:PST family polysaccharide transporter
VNKLSNKIIKLFCIRFNQIAVPLLIYPYTISVVGLESFGVISFWLGLSAFFAKIISLNMDSFSLRVVSRSLGNQYELKKSIIMPLFIKGFISLFFIPIYIIFAFNYVTSNEQFVVALFCLYPILQAVFNFNHYFVATGKFNIWVFISFFSNVFLLLGVFTLVNKPEDYTIYPIVYFLSVLLPIPVIFKVMKLNVFKFNFSILLRSSKEYISVSKWLVTGKLLQLHMNAAKPIIGFLFGYTAVAIYDISEKIVNISKIPFSIISDSLFSEQMKKGHAFLRVSFISIFISFLIYSLLYFFGEYALLYLMGNQYTIESFTILKILSLILFITPLSLLFGVNFVVKFAEQTLYGKFLLSSSVISVTVLGLLFFTCDFGLKTFSFWVVFCEFILFFHCFVYFIKEQHVKSL